jgi:hypothetical protein
MPGCMERDSGSVTAAFHGCRSAVGADCAPGRLLLLFREQKPGLRPRRAMRLGGRMITGPRSRARDGLRVTSGSVAAAGRGAIRVRTRVMPRPAKYEQQRCACPGQRTRLVDVAHGRALGADDLDRGVRGGGCAAGAGVVGRRVAAAEVGRRECGRGGPAGLRGVASVARRQRAGRVGLCRVALVCGWQGAGRCRGRGGDRMHDAVAMVATMRRLRVNVMRALPLDGWWLRALHRAGVCLRCSSVRRGCRA